MEGENRAAETPLTGDVSGGRLSGDDTLAAAATNPTTTGTSALHRITTLAGNLRERVVRRRRKRKRRLVYRAVWTSAEEFHEIVISGTMGPDHMPNSLGHVLREAYDGACDNLATEKIPYFPLRILLTQILVLGDASLDFLIDFFKRHNLIFKARTPRVRKITFVNDNGTLKLVGPSSQAELLNVITERLSAIEANVAGNNGVSGKGLFAGNGESYQHQQQQHQRQQHNPSRLLEFSGRNAVTNEDIEIEDIAGLEATAQSEKGVPSVVLRQISMAQRIKAAVPTPPSTVKALPIVPTV
ncbi:hypothetical protein HDU76_007868 [Blyttiomyces sp. JEL0837]|nr:hypothetical protein HDU76_007868 [Blyttiomyces sp. JEL0837]